MTDEVLTRVRRIEDHVIEIHGFMGGAEEWRSSVDRTLGEHEKEIEEVKTFRAKIIGMWMAAAALGGVGFQVVVTLMRGS